MKQVLFFGILAAFSMTLLGQVQLEQSYNYSGTLTEISDDEYKYFVMDVPMNQCRIYNEDHTLFKTITLSVPSGYYLNDVKFVTRHTFNSDDNIELLYIYMREAVVNTKTVYYYGLKVVSETGSVLLTLSDGGYAEIQEGNDGKKLLAYRYIWNSGYYLVYTNVYSLAKSTKTADATSESGLSLYPNPATTEIYLSAANQEEKISKVIVSDMTGRVRHVQAVGEGEMPVHIPTGDLEPGTYILNRMSNGRMLGGIPFEKAQTSWIK